MRKYKFKAQTQKDFIELLTLFFPKKHKVKVCKDGTLDVTFWTNADKEIICDIMDRVDDDMFMSQSFQDCNIPLDDGESAFCFNPYGGGWIAEYLFKCDEEELRDMGFMCAESNEIPTYDEYGNALQFHYQQMGQQPTKERLEWEIKQAMRVEDYLRVKELKERLDALNEKDSKENS